MATEGMGLSIADALALQKNEDGGFMGGGSLILFLFFLMAMGNGNMFGGTKNGDYVTNQGMQDQFNFAALERQNNETIAAVKDSTVQMLASNNQLQMQVVENGHLLQSCCCETNRNIDSMKYENLQNANSIITAGNMNTQRIIDTMTQNTIQDLRDRLQDEKFASSQCAQNAYLIGQLQPVARPAYLTCSPYSGVCNATAGNGNS